METDTGRNKFRHVGIDGVLELQNRRAYAEADNARFVAKLMGAKPPAEQPEEPTSFERQLAMVKAGHGIREVVPFNRGADPAVTLAGVGSRWMAS